MDCEIKNVIQVESNTKDLVVSTKPARVQSQNSTSGGIQQFLKAQIQFIFVLSLLFAPISDLRESILQSVKFRKVLGKTRIFILTLLLAIVCIGQIPQVFAQGTPALSVEVEYETPSFNDQNEGGAIIVATATSVHSPEDGKLTYIKRRLIH